MNKLKLWLVIALAIMAMHYASAGVVDVWTSMRFRRQPLSPARHKFERISIP